jgi:hypothetical protein
VPSNISGRDKGFSLMRGDMYGDKSNTAHAPAYSAVLEIHLG